MNLLRLVGELALAVGVALIAFDVLSPAARMGSFALLVTLALIVLGSALVFWSFGQSRSTSPKS